VQSRFVVTVSTPAPPDAGALLIVLATDTSHLTADGASTTDDELHATVRMVRSAAEKRKMFSSQDKRELALAGVRSARIANAAELQDGCRRADPIDYGASAAIRGQPENRAAP
jgi:hypothetical protein